MVTRDYLGGTTSDIMQVGDLDDYEYTFDVNDNKCKEKDDFAIFEKNERLQEIKDGWHNPFKIELPKVEVVHDIKKVIRNQLKKPG